MPFTFAHPAAILPIYQRWPDKLVLSALVIGSMVPDLHYFLPLQAERSDAHSLIGIAWFCLPVGAWLYLLFHLLLKRPGMQLLPDAIAERLATNTPLLPHVSYVAVTVSMIIGTLTHLLWDAFTHQNYLTAQMLPWLTHELIEIHRYRVYPYKILQHGSTLIGAAILLIWTARWIERTPKHPKPARNLPWRFRLTLLLTGAGFPAIIAVPWAYSSFMASSGLMQVSDLAREVVIVYLTLVNILFLIYCISWHVVPSIRTAKC